MNLKYWIDLEECACASEHPIGGCLKCDLVKAQKEFDEVVKALESWWNTGECPENITEILARARYSTKDTRPRAPCGSL